MEGTPGEEKPRTSPVVMYPNDAAIASISCKTENRTILNSQHLDFGRTAGAQLAAHADQYYNSHT